MLLLSAETFYVWLADKGLMSKHTEVCFRVWRDYSMTIKAFQWLKTRSPWGFLVILMSAYGWIDEQIESAFLSVCDGTRKGQFPEHLLIKLLSPGNASTLTFIKWCTLELTQQTRASGGFYPTSTSLFFVWELMRLINTLCCHERLSSSCCCCCLKACLNL